MPTLPHDHAFGSTLIPQSATPNTTIPPIGPAPIEVPPMPSEHDPAGMRQTDAERVSSERDRRIADATRLGELAADLARRPGLIVSHHLRGVAIDGEPSVVDATVSAIIGPWEIHINISAIPSEPFAIYICSDDGRAEMLLVPRAATYERVLLIVDMFLLGRTSIRGHR